jgi:hypothetical protein
MTHWLTYLLCYTNKEKDSLEYRSCRIEPTVIPLTRKDPVRREQIEEMLMTKQNHKELRVPGTVCLCPSTVAVTDMPTKMAKENAGRVEEEVMTETEVLPLTTLDAEKDV